MANRMERPMKRDEILTEDDLKELEQRAVDKVRAEAKINEILDKNVPGRRAKREAVHDGDPQITLEEMFGPDKASRMRREAETRESVDRRKLPDY